MVSLHTYILTSTVVSGDGDGSGGDAGGEVGLICPREPTESFGNPSEIADHFIDLAMDEGVSPEMMRGGIVLLNQAKEAFDDQGMLKTV